MSEERSIEEGMIRIKIKVLIPSIIALLVTTNTATGLIFNLEENTETIEYNDNKDKRRNAHLKQELQDYVDDRFYELRIEELEAELKNCK